MGLIMASSGEKFLKGLISAQRGISAAYVNDLIENDRRKEEERELERQAKMDRLYEQNVLSQIKSREQEEPEEPSIPKMSFETPGGIKISGEENEKMQAALEKYGVKKPEEDKKEEKPAYNKGQAWDDAIALWKNRLNKDLSREQEYANMRAASTGQPLPYKAEEMPAMETIQATADSLFQKQNTGEYGKPAQSSEQAIIDQIKANPKLIETTDWKKVKEENPDIDWDAIFNALEQM